MKNKTLLLFVVLLLVITAGCVGSNETPRPNNLGAPSKSFESPLQGKVTGDTGNAVNIIDRKIISTASVTLEVKSVEKASNEITKIVEASQGFISDSSTYDSGGSKNGQMTIRVPQKNFYSTIEQIEALGTEKSRQISGQDVTEEWIDVGARLDNFKKQESRFQEILKNASTVKDVLEVERELERVRGEIESLTGRMNYLNQSVEMSTITVNVMEPAPIAGDGWGITEALREAVIGFIGSVNGLIVFTGYILPIVVFIALMVLLARWVKRKVLPWLKQ
ncbi:MAG: DUF4349 domain-containing protein [Candidatus Methanoperedens sp.]|nr:DUF4349 domain-containing protein [Candidatus Methanoperedens sp.]MCZ7369530.1 DUF4349 domain-containing protein [Candidatus Methanoperedens sp.]